MQFFCWNYSELKADKRIAKSFYVQYQKYWPVLGKRLAESYDYKTFVVQNPPPMPLTIEEMDDVYALPLYAHLSSLLWKKQAGVPAISEVKFSLVSNRGCFGGVQFLGALTFIRAGSFRYEAMNPLSKKQNAYEGTWLQRIYPRCRWSDSKFQGTCL